MSQTFHDFAVECELYPHSKEAYELTKECMELELMYEYLDAKENIRESTEMGDVSCSDLPDGFLVESFDGSTRNQFLMEAAEKKGGILRKIYRGFKKIVDNFCNFWKRLFRINTELEDRAKVLRKRLQTFEFDEKTYKTLKDTCEQTLKGFKDTFQLKSTQPDVKKITLRFNSTVKPALITSRATIPVVDAVSAALSDNFMVAEVAFTQGKTKLNSKTLGVISVEELKKVIDQAVSNINALTRATSTFTAAWTVAKKDGIRIPTNEKTVKKIEKDLQDMSDKLNRQITEIADRAKLPAATLGMITDRNSGEPAKKIDKMMNPLYQGVYTIIGPTMTMYSNSMVFRKTMIEKLETLVPASATKTAKS